MTAPRIHVGVGGWTFEPWRDNFYPKGLAHAKELQYASRQLTAIEINGTFYRTFAAPSFEKWRDETPEGFVFSVKAHRSTTHRKQLSTAGDAIERFVRSGITALGDKLGPIVWQLMPTSRFDPAQLEPFLAALPSQADGIALRHVIDARDGSFACRAYIDLLRRYGCATVHTDSDQYPAIADPRSDLAYLRLMRTSPECPTGYPADRLAAWAAGCRAWVAGGPKREVFAYFISGAKERAPAAALALLRQLRA